MAYQVLRYGPERFGPLYPRIRAFLETCGDGGCGEHFHWGRMSWMLEHTLLEEERLGRIGVFLGADGRVMGLVTYDMRLRDSAYLLHGGDDPALLRAMLDFAEENYAPLGYGEIKTDSLDGALIDLLKTRGYRRERAFDRVLALDLRRACAVDAPVGIRISPEGFMPDPWETFAALYRGFDHPGTPEPPPPCFPVASPDDAGRIWAVGLDAGGEYLGMCGMWYLGGDTAYVEPVAVVPEARRRGLGRALVLTAGARAGARGAKRAVVLSDMDFYKNMGFETSSEMINWGKATRGGQKG